MDSHIVPFGHIILIQNLPVFALTVHFYFLSRETANTTLIVFGLTLPGLELTIYLTRFRFSCIIGLDQISIIIFKVKMISVENVLHLITFLFITFKAFTMPEYLRKRFGGKRIRMYCSFFALIGYILFNISVCTITFHVFFYQMSQNILKGNTSCI